MDCPSYNESTWLSVIVDRVVREAMVSGVGCGIGLKTGEWDCELGMLICTDDPLKIRGSGENSY